MLRMNFPERRKQRRLEAEERAKRVKPENTKQFRLVAKAALRLIEKNQVNNCKCGKNCIRITFHGESYCWACYDEMMKAKDVAASNLLRSDYLKAVRDIIIYKSTQ